MKRILHITPHLGGGVGTVLLNWLKSDKNNIHTIATLDYANDKAIKMCRESEISLFSQIEKNDLIEKIQENDIILIHFWNHPLLFDFLIRYELPPSRIIMWSHISGARPPYVFNKKLFDICEKFVFTTPISFDFVKKSNKSQCILSTGDMQPFQRLTLKPHTGYNIGYIGTVDFAKMHPDYYKTINKTNADKIYIVGGDKEKEIFKNVDERYIVTGKLDDIKEVMSNLDVFAYLLNPEHYGTAEQVLQEAMSAGIVPVVMNNPCEKSLVTHLETGLVAKDINEYVSYINLLKEDFVLRNKLSQNAKKYALEHFDIKNLINEWNTVFDEIIRNPKTSKKWPIEKKELDSYDIFEESLGEFSEVFKNKTQKELKNIIKKNNWNSDTKASPKQYYRFLGGNRLKKLYELYFDE